MKPITPNVKPELKKIRETLELLTESVNEIKSILTVTEPLHQIENMYRVSRGRRGMKLKKIKVLQI